MPSSPLPGRLRLVFRLTAFSATIGAVYSEMHAAQDNNPLFGFYAAPRGPWSAL